MIEKIFDQHGKAGAKPGEIVDLEIDVRIARDFGGANVVGNLESRGLGLDDPSRTFFTFDTNPTGSDQKYAANQQRCRIFARKEGVRVYDIDAGIGTHVALEEGMALPGKTLVSTDSHANIVGAIGAFGQGLGDVDMAQVFAYGKTWFRLPPSLRIELTGKPGPFAKPKDLVLALLQKLGASGLLGHSAEFHGEYAEQLGLDDRITISSMATEMGAIIALFPPNEEVIAYCRARNADFEALYPDEDAEYSDRISLNLDGLRPMIARPGKPDDTCEVRELAGRKIDSAFIGSCTNGRLSDLRAAAELLRGKQVADGVVLKIVPSTDRIWKTALEEGLIEIFKDAGALVGNAGCGGCAAGQIGMNGPGEVTLSTGNRNYPGKQGRGEVYLASPSTVASSALSGVIASEEEMPAGVTSFPLGSDPTPRPASREDSKAEGKPEKLKGRVWVIDQDDIDTDMIFHNRYLAITELSEMAPYTFDNLEGWEDFSKMAKPGDIVVTGSNFGAGSSRQQAVDCFKALGITVILARSFGAIYERNAVNAGMPILEADLIPRGLQDGEIIEVDLRSGMILREDGSEFTGKPCSEVALEIYQRGGLLESREEA
jgi:3-isopropylmalate dehydratase small subunit